MKLLTVKKLIVPVVIATIVIGCAELQKPQSLLDAEKAYSLAANSFVVQKHSSDQLAKANETLLSAAVAESAEDMISLAYIANVQVETAVISAAAEQSRKNSKDILTQKEHLIAASISTKKEKAQITLHAMQVNEAEREILLAFGDIQFVTGTADLVPGALRGIEMLANHLAKYPGKKVSLAGHTDNSGSAALNRNLSQRRADFIRDVLISKGVAPERIAAIGYGQSQPIASNDTREGRQNNRRIEIKFN